jgi:hypothetical protein
VTAVLEYLLLIPDGPGQITTRLCLPYRGPMAEASVPAHRQAQETGALAGSGRMSIALMRRPLSDHHCFVVGPLSVDARRYQSKASFVNLPLLGQLRLLQCEGTSGGGLLLISSMDFTRTKTTADPHAAQTKKDGTSCRTLT